MIKPWLFEFFPELGDEARDPPPGDIADYFTRYLELWTRDEALGFEGIFFSEHHFGGSFSASPNLLIAAVAQRTRKQPTHLPGMPTRREVVEYYCANMGLEPGNWTFYEVFGLFRLAVIMQQIYYRYREGQTHNPAFQHFGRFVTYLAGRCRAAIESA